ncbi:MAG TPA: hypothetical protein VL326_22505 [Kofleriaceae bacterium]|nr:hypothetical protein [Kofleriaceae bacterium]
MILFQLLEPLVFVLPTVLWLVVLGPLVLYPVARWKAHREPHLDTQLGLKVALHTFRFIAFQLLLVGAMIVLWTVMRKTSDGRGDFYRAGFGLLLPAALVFGGHVMLLMRTNDSMFPTVRRLYFGYNLVVTGLLGLVALVVASEALFSKGSSGDNGRLCYAAFVVYVAAWVGCGWHYINFVATDSSAPPQNIVPPAPGMQAAAGQGPGLPSLGGGFPPVSQ